MLRTLRVQVFMVNTVVTKETNMDELQKATFERSEVILLAEFKIRAFGDIKMI